MKIGINGRANNNYITHSTPSNSCLLRRGATIYCECPFQKSCAAASLPQPRSALGRSRFKSQLSRCDEGLCDFVEIVSKLGSRNDETETPPIRRGLSFLKQDNSNTGKLISFVAPAKKCSSFKYGSFRRCPKLLQILRNQTLLFGQALISKSLSTTAFRLRLLAFRSRPWELLKHRDGRRGSNRLR